MLFAKVVGVLLLFSVGTVLEGCGDGPSPSTSPSPSPDPPSPAPPPSHPWLSNPIEVRGQHLYDSVTGDSFFAMGIAFPNLAEDATVDDYITTIKRLKGLSSNLNMIRMYQFPQCMWETEQGWCMGDFMEEADKLGIYVLVAATGSATGYLPDTNFTDAQDCYQKGGALDMGRGIVQRLNYPNTLAIVIGNEFMKGGQGVTEHAYNVISVLKAYARDLKAYMDTCHTDTDSPSSGAFRKIPLLYASIDSSASVMNQKAAYLFCGSAATSIDIYGLNIERWCDPSASDAYDEIQTMVSNAAFPGSFIFSEMGCPQDQYPGQVRQWHQVNDFFASFPAIDGFAGYSYFNDNTDGFSMFDAGTPDATELQDGTNFFAALDAVGNMTKRDAGEATYTSCGIAIDGVAIEPLSGIHAYNTAAYPASSCPAPRQNSGSAGLVVA